MFSFRKKRIYQCPRVDLASADLEGIICDSMRVLIEVNPLESVNDDETSSEPLYFEP